MESNYTLRNSTALQARSMKIVVYGSDTIFSLRPKLWDILSTELKYTVPNTLFKKKKKKKIGPQRITHVIFCKTYEQILEFMHVI